MEFIKFTETAWRFSMVLDTAKTTQGELQPPTYMDYLWVYLMVGAIGFAVMYGLKAAALYTIGKREGFKHTWMAFVPFLNTYYIGVVSEKNKTFGVKTKYVALGAAIAEAATFALYVLNYVVTFWLYNNGYIQPQLIEEIYGGQTIQSYVYSVRGLPFDMAWLGWIYGNIETLVISWVELVYVICNVFVLIAFFRTYATQSYVLFTVLSVIFPIDAIIMFAYRKRKGMNYTEYLRQQRQKQYAAYQEYMRKTGQNPDGYGNTYGQGGNTYGQQPSTPPEDPFGGLGASGNGGDFDPFDIPSDNGGTSAEAASEAPAVSSTEEIKESETPTTSATEEIEINTADDPFSVPEDVNTTTDKFDDEENI